MEGNGEVTELDGATFGSVDADFRAATALVYCNFAANAAHGIDDSVDFFIGKVIDEGYA